MNHTSRELANRTAGWQQFEGAHREPPQSAVPPSVWQRSWALLQSRSGRPHPAPLVASVFRCYSEVFFINGSIAFGMLIFASTLLNWNVGLSGLIAVVAAYGFARLIHLDYEFFQPGFYTYNPLLVGLSIGKIIDLVPPSLEDDLIHNFSFDALFYIGVAVFFIVTASVLTLLLTIAMVNIFRWYFNLPVLSLPFALCSVMTYLASLRYSNLLVASAPAPAWLAVDYYFPNFQLPIWISGFLRSLGSVFFLPYEIVGLLFAGLLLCRSRILFLLAILGYYTGTPIRAAVLGSVPQAFGDISSFNFILIAMALGGVLLTPSVGSYFIAIVAVAVSTIFLDAVQMLGVEYGIPAYALPFNVVSLGVVYALALTSFPHMARYVGLTPEETLENDVTIRHRYPGYLRTMQLPFFGQWTVWQAFNDQWTHKGSWQYAYDFVITDDEGKTFDGAGLQLDNYYCFRKPVLSPLRGRVMTVVNDLPDNPVGQVDKTNNWGNHVVIYDERGYYVEISHLAEGSIRVKPGDWVEPGVILGLCGNSGYSPQPHLHMHIQMYQYVGSPTLPFSFVSYLSADTYHANDLPARGDRLQPAPAVDPQLDARTGFLLGDKLTYEVLRDGKRIAGMTLTVNMALDGTMYFASDRGGRMYFGKHQGTFYCYRVEGPDKYLKLLYLACPRMPLCYRDGFQWQDVVPASLVLNGPQRWLANLMATLVPRAAIARTVQRFCGVDRIETEIRSGVFGTKCQAIAQWDAERGLAVVQVERVELRRVGYATAT